MLVKGLFDDERICERSFDFIDGFEIGCYPGGEFVCRDVGFALDGIRRVFSASWVVQAGHGKSRVVSTVEEQGVVLEFDAHADDGMFCRGRFVKRPRNHESFWHNANVLAVSAAPIEVAAKEDGSFFI